jgi:hypothetical protein
MGFLRFSTLFVISLTISSFVTVYFLKSFFSSTNQVETMRPIHEINKRNLANSQSVGVEKGIRYIKQVSVRKKSYINFFP